MIKYFKRHGVLLTFLSVLFFVSIIIGVFLYIKSSNESKEFISNQLINLKDNLLNTKINNVLKHSTIHLIRKKLNLATLKCFFVIMLIWSSLIKIVEKIIW